MAVPVNLTSTWWPRPPSSAIVRSRRETTTPSAPRRAASWASSRPAWRRAPGDREAPDPDLAAPPEPGGRGPGDPDTRGAEDQARGDPAGVEQPGELLRAQVAGERPGRPDAPLGPHGRPVDAERQRVHLARKRADLDVDADGAVTAQRTAFGVQPLHRARPREPDHRAGPVGLGRVGVPGRQVRCLQGLLPHAHRRAHDLPNRREAGRAQARELPGGQPRGPGGVPRPLAGHVAATGLASRGSHDGLHVPAPGRTGRAGPRWARSVARAGWGSSARRISE